MNSFTVIISLCFSPFLNIALGEQDYKWYKEPKDVFFQGLPSRSLILGHPNPTEKPASMFLRRFKNTYIHMKKLPLPSSVLGYILEKLAFQEPPKVNLFPQAIYLFFHIRSGWWGGGGGGRLRNVGRVRGQRWGEGPAVRPANYWSLLLSCCA